MSNHKYSHALVMSHFEDSGLLSLHDRKPKSSATSPRRVSQSWTISETLPPSKSSRSKSPDRVTEVRSRSRQEEGISPSSAPGAVQIPDHSVSIGRSDSVVTQVYAPCRPSPSFDKQRARQRSNPRDLLGLRAAIIPHDQAWEPQLAARGMASPKSPRCTCGAIVQDARLQSSYFPDTKAPQKPLPTLPRDISQAMVNHNEGTLIQERNSTPRFELAAPTSPRQPPASETASIKPIRRMASPRSPTTKTPISARSSSSWPKPEATTKISLVEDSPTSGSEAVFNPRPSSMSDPSSRPLSSQTSPPTSPSLSSIFSFPSPKPSQDAPPEAEYTKLHIHDKDITILPWDNPHMGPEPSYSSPPPSLNYLDRSQSPASSIDDATPPPISRVRRDPAQRPSTSAPKSKTLQRTRALSSSVEARPKTSHAPPLPTTIPTQQPASHRKRNPSLNIRGEPTGIRYSGTTAGPEPIPTTERIAPPPPLIGALIRGSQEKELERMRWGRLRGMFGFGRSGGRGFGPGVGAGLGAGKGHMDAAFIRGLVPS